VTETKENLLPLQDQTLGGLKHLMRRTKLSWFFLILFGIGANDPVSACVVEVTVESVLVKAIVLWEAIPEGSVPDGEDAMMGLDTRHMD
jgi:hypothetical protein